MSTLAARLAKYAADPGEFFRDMIRSLTGRDPAPFQLERFGLLAPALVAVARGDKPPCGRVWIEATKGGSKDTDAIIGLLWLLCFATRPVYAQAAAGDAEQCRDALKVAAALARRHPWLGERLTIGKAQITCAANGSQCDFVSTDAPTAHGARPDFLWVNELTHMVGDGGQDFAETLMDNAAKMPHGLALVTTNAGHVGTWQHKWHETAISSPLWQFHALHEPPPWVDPAQVAEAKARNSVTRFNRLWGCRWSPPASTALDPDVIERAMTLARPMHERPDADWHFVAGLDLGLVKDRAALCVLGTKAGSGRITLAVCRSWSPQGGQIDLAAIEQAVLSAHRRYRLHSLIYDPWQAEHMAQNLRRQFIACEPMVFSGRSLVTMAVTLLDVFASGVIDIFPHDELIRDLGRLMLVEKSYGVRLESTRDADGHADMATALVIALPAAARLAHIHAYGPPTFLTLSSYDPNAGRRFGVLLEH